MVDGNDIGGMVGVGLFAGVALAEMGMIGHMVESIEDQPKKKKQKKRSPEQDMFDILF